MSTRLSVLAGLLLCASIATGCRVARPAHPDDIYGHRFEGLAPDGRRTVTVEPRPESVAYLQYPVIIDSVHVRHGLFQPDIPLEDQTVPVNVLIKGSFPNACTELDQIEQRRVASLIRVSLLMRMARRLQCERIVNYYRYYFDLDGEYSVGHYTLFVNDQAFPFQVMPRISD